MKGNCTDGAKEEPSVFVFFTYHTQHLYTHHTLKITHTCTQITYILTHTHTLSHTHTHYTHIHTHAHTFIRTYAHTHVHSHTHHTHTYTHIHSHIIWTITLVAFPFSLAIESNWLFESPAKMITTWQVRCCTPEILAFGRWRPRSSDPALGTEHVVWNPILKVSSSCWCFFFHFASWQPLKCACTSSCVFGSYW